MGRRGADAAFQSFSKNLRPVGSGGFPGFGRPFGGYCLCFQPASPRPSPAKIPPSWEESPEMDRGGNPAGQSSQTIAPAGGKGTARTFYLLRPGPVWGGRCCPWAFLRFQKSPFFHTPPAEIRLLGETDCSAEQNGGKGKNENFPSALFKSPPVCYHEKGSFFPGKKRFTSDVKEF